jgi:tRNA-2-methylthio-N6-dimethylallyladenosine synthase
MNFHDSERLAGLLEEAGYQRARSGEDPDVVVFNTCAVRENADNRLYGNLGHLLPVKNARPGMQIAVGGCLAQKDRAGIARRAPWVDVVFGTHNIGSLPVLLERARVQEQAQVEIVESLERFPSVLPARRESPYAAWVAISVGCNNTCTFCIVPSLRGREEDRRPGDVLAEIRALVSDGVLEVTLLGQNVNSYGVGFGDRTAFGRLLRACGEIDGLERVRFTSPHPADFTDDVIEAMAATHNVMPQLHMPLQSGSDAVLRAMRRAYRREKYLRILARVRATIPGAAITSDIIVGFPGETERDFADTLDLVRQARFAGAYTFQYSPRPGTPAAAMDGQVPPEVVAERYERLAALVAEVALAENETLTGSQVEVLVAEGEGRKDGVTHRMSGRARDNRLVHFAPAGASPRPGDVVTTTVTSAAPHYLIADEAPLTVRRTPGGDAWQARQEGAEPGGRATGVLLDAYSSARLHHDRGRPDGPGARGAGAVETGHADRGRRPPHPPLLIPAAIGAAASDPPPRWAPSGCPDAAVRALARAEPDLIAVVGGGTADREYEAGAAGSLGDYGIAVTVGEGEPVLPLSLTVGRWLLDRAGVGPGNQSPGGGPPVLLQAVDQRASADDCLKLGAAIAERAPRVALLAMGDASARGARDIEGVPDPRARDYDDEVAEALAAADARWLGRLDPALDGELLVAGRAAWQVLAGAAAGARMCGRLSCMASPYGVTYLVASWERPRAD